MVALMVVPWAELRAVWMAGMMEVYLVEQLVEGTDDQMVALKVVEKVVQKAVWLADHLGFLKGEQKVVGMAV